MQNEPHADSQRHERRGHSIIRESNPDRQIILGGLQWMDYRWIADEVSAREVLETTASDRVTLFLATQLTACYTSFTNPDGSKDMNIMVEIHNYDPSTSRGIRGRVPGEPPTTMRDGVHLQLHVNLECRTTTSRSCSASSAV